MLLAMKRTASARSAIERTKRLVSMSKNVGLRNKSLSKSELTWSPFACTIHKWASCEVYFKERCIDSGNLPLSMLKDNTMNIRQKQKKPCIIIPYNL